MLVSLPLWKLDSPLNPLNKEQASNNCILAVRTLPESSQEIIKLCIVYIQLERSLRKN